MRHDAGAAPMAGALLVLAYAMGVGGALRDWREHLAGVTLQPPHLLIDLGGLLAIGVLAFTDARPRPASFLPLYLLLALAAVLVLGPFGLMLVAPRSDVMRSYMAWMMTSSGLLVFLPLLAVAGAVLDMAWHQAHPMVTEMSMNMLTLPGHQLILSGFALGLFGSTGTHWRSR